MRLWIPVAFLMIALGACSTASLRVAGGVGLVDVSGRASLDNSSGSLDLGTVRNQLGDLDLGDTQVAPYLRGDLDLGNHRVTVSTLGFRDDGSSTLSQDFGDILAGTSVSTDLDYVNIKAAYSYRLVDFGFLTIRPGIAANTLLTDMEVTTASAFEQVETAVAVPMPFVQAEAFFGPLQATLDVGGMDISVVDADGTYWDIEAYLTYRPTDKVDLFAGYRFIDMDTDGEADSRQFDADLTVRGVFLGFGLRF